MSIIYRIALAQQLRWLQGGGLAQGELPPPPPPPETYDDVVATGAASGSLVAWIKGPGFSDSQGTFDPGTSIGTVSPDGDKLPGSSVGDSVDFGGDGYLSFSHPGEVVELSTGTMVVLVRADVGSLAGQRGIIGTIHSGSDGDISLWWDGVDLVFEIFDGSLLHQARAPAALEDGQSTCVQFMWGGSLVSTGEAFDDGSSFDDGSAFDDTEAGGGDGGTAEMRLRVNGTNVAQNDYSGGIPASVTGPWLLGAIGSGGTAGEHWAGLIAHWQIYDRVLTDGELDALQPFTSEPFAFNDNAGTVPEDEGFVDVDVLDNDLFVGTPSLSIVSQTGPGTAVLAGSGFTSRIQIPTDAGVGVKTVTYELTSSDTVGSSQAVVTLEVVVAAATFDAVVEGSTARDDLLVWLKGDSGTDSLGTLGSGTVVGFVADPPVNTMLPEILGSTEEGSTLTCTTGSWDNSPESYSYQWRRDGTPISGATTSIYVAVDADVGTMIGCTVVASNVRGASPPADAVEVGPITGQAVPVNTSPPVVTGSTTRGRILSSTTGEWTADPVNYDHQWLRDGAPIAGETSDTYTTGVDDVGSMISCEVVAINEQGASAPAVSNSLGPIVSDAVFTESWTGDTGAGWDATRWPVQVDEGTAVADITAADEGRLEVGGVDPFALIFKQADLSIADFNLTVTFRLTDAFAEQYVLVQFRTSGGWAAGARHPVGGYIVSPGIFGGVSSLYLGRMDGDGLHVEIAEAEVEDGWGTGTWNLRVRAFGTALKVKSWPQGTQEPSDWVIEVTDETFAGPGTIELGMGNGADAVTRTVFFDDLVVSEPIPFERVPAEVISTGAENSAGNPVTLQDMDFTVSVGSNLLVLVLALPGEYGDVGLVEADYDPGGAVGGPFPLEMRVSRVTLGAKQYVFTRFNPPVGTSLPLRVTVSGAATRMTLFPYSVRNAVVVRDTGVAAGDGSNALLAVNVPSASDDLVLAGWAWRNSASDVTSYGEDQFGQDDEGLNGQSSRAAASWQRAEGSLTTASINLTTDPDNLWAATGVAIKGKVATGSSTDVYTSIVSDISNKLVAYWRMGDTATNLLADDSGNGRHGTYPLAPAAFGAAELAGVIVGSDGKAVDFGGVGYGEVAHEAAYLLGRGTLSFYFKVNSLADHTLIHKGTTLHVRAMADGSMRLAFGAVAMNSKTGIIQPGVEYHVAVLWDEVSVWLMLDGRMLFWDRGHTNGLTGEAGTWEFGRSNSGVNADVVLDEVVLYGKRLAHWSGDYNAATDLDFLSEWARGLGYDPTPETSEVVDTVAGIETALQAAADAPGHHILVAAGTYNGVTATMTRGGAKRRPIVVRPQDPGTVTFTNHDITIQGSWIVFDGLAEQSGRVRIDRSAARYVRFTRMTVTDIDTHHYQTWGMFGRFDHNDYSDVPNVSAAVNCRVMVDSEGVDPSGQSEKCGAYTLIDHNYHHDAPDFGGNGNEAIQIGNGDGDSRDRALDPWCTVYRNRIVRYMADVEPISYKANGCLAVENNLRNMAGGIKTGCRHGGFHWWERESWHNVSDHDGNQGVRVLSEGNILIGCRATGGTRIFVWPGDVSPNEWRTTQNGSYPAARDTMLIGCRAGNGNIIVGDPVNGHGVRAVGTQLFQCSAPTIGPDQNNTQVSGNKPTPYTTAGQDGITLANVGPVATDPLVPVGWK